jgi:hypothetical protein
MLSILAFALSHAADVQIAHQGRLLDANGNPYNGTLPAVVRLWTSPTTGTLVFDDALDMTFQDGYFSVILGATPGDPLTTGMLSTPGGLWVESTVNGVTFSQRQPLLSVPRAAVADTVLSGGSVTAGASMIRVGGFLGYGTSNNAIHRFSFVQETIGTDIVRTVSATDGDSFTVQKTMLCSLTMSAAHDSSSNLVGFTKNIPNGHAELDVEPIYADGGDLYKKRLAWAHNNQGGGIDMNVAWTGILQAGDVVRVHGNGIAPNTIRWVRNAFTMVCWP